MNKVSALSLSLQRRASFYLFQVKFVDCCYVCGVCCLNNFLFMLKWWEKEINVFDTYSGINSPTLSYFFSYLNWGPKGRVCYTDDVQLMVHYPCQGGYVFTHVFVCWFVSKTTKWFSRNFDGVWVLAQNKLHQLFDVCLTFLCRRVPCWLDNGLWDIAYFILIFESLCWI